MRIAFTHKSLFIVAHLFSPLTHILLLLRALLTLAFTIFLLPHSHGDCYKTLVNADLPKTIRYFKEGKKLTVENEAFIKYFL